MSGKYSRTSVLSGVSLNSGMSHVSEVSLLIVDSGKLERFAAILVDRSKSAGWTSTFASPSCIFWNCDTWRYNSTRGVFFVRLCHVGIGISPVVAVWYYQTRFQYLLEVRPWLTSRSWSWSSEWLRTGLEMWTIEIIRRSNRKSKGYQIVRIVCNSHVCGQMVGTLA